MATVGFKGLN